MAAWFGHTQTLTSISKSVATVASGILGLEANLATFMQKVGYYEKFFERMEPNLPVEVVTTATRLFARCYEYRAEIRDELESSLAYVADAGRWVVGMEDWNSKMEKRLGQISELVLLANTLLVEFAVTGAWGAPGAKDALDGYLRHIADSVVLHNTAQVKKPKTAVAVARGADSSEQVMENPLFPPATSVSTDSTASSAQPPGSETNYNPLFPPPAPASGESPVMSDNEGELFLARSSAGSSTGVEAGIESAPTRVGPTQVSADDDEDVLNPFARAYQPPVSVESSLASLRAESDNGSVYFNAMDQQQMSVLSGGGSGGDREDDDADEPDSPVSLGEYECLEMDSIPQYVAFKPTAFSRKRRLQQQFFGGPSTSASPSASIESLAPTQMSLAAPALSPSPSKESPRRTNGVKRGGDLFKDRQRLMDLTYSYDFQRELSFNPFASPGMSSASATGVALPPQLDISDRPRVPTVQEEDAAFEIKEQVFGHDRQNMDNHEPVRERLEVEVAAASTLSSPPPMTPTTEAVQDLIEDAIDAVVAEMNEAAENGSVDIADAPRDKEEVESSPPGILTRCEDDQDLSPGQSDGSEQDLSSSIGSDELSAVFYSAPDEFSRLLRDEDTLATGGVVDTNHERF